LVTNVGCDRWISTELAQSSRVGHQVSEPPPPGTWHRRVPGSSSPTCRPSAGSSSHTRSAAYVSVDVTDAEQIAVNIAIDLGPLRALVNSAGIGWAQRTIGKDGEFASAHNLDAYKRVLAINLVGTFDCIRLAATAMSQLDPTATGERGAIVNMTSVAAFDGQIGQAAYSSSKGGVVGLTLPVARDLSAVGIRVNTVAPGLIDTPIYGEGEASEAFKAKLGESVLFPHRLGKPEELASMVIELLTNSYMNAEIVRVDGGIRMPPK